MTKLNLMNNELCLILGTDIPFVEATVTMHQPRMQEISYIGEEALFTGCELLKFSKDILTSEDNLRLKDYTDFNILMSILNDKSASMQNNVSCALMVLDLLFPLYQVTVTPAAIVFLSQENQVCGMINDNNFAAFKSLLNTVFCLEKTSAEEYNTQGELAKKIADKFKKRKQKLAELKQKPNKVAIFSRYISILTVGEHKDINSFMNYTVYQLLDEFQRFQLKMAYDVYFKARIAGASDLKEPEDWMKDLHDGSNKK